MDNVTTTITTTTTTTIMFNNNDTNTVDHTYNHMATNYMNSIGGNRLSNTTCLTGVICTYVYIYIHI